MSDTDIVPPRCEREHRIEQWPFSRRCQGTAEVKVRFDEDGEKGDWLSVCALCLVDVRKAYAPESFIVADLEDTEGEEE